MSPSFNRLLKPTSSSEIPVYKNLTALWILFCLAALSFLTTLHLPYNGEEAVYTITSLEMWFNQEWISPTLYGFNYGRPPLLNWFIIPLTSLLGWKNVLLASRCVASLSTLLTAVLLIWMIQRLFKEKSFSVWGGLAYLSGDLLFRRGWLAYADPLFSLFVFSAIALTWVAFEEKKRYLLLLANLCIIASFLTKAMTGYVFYGIALFVLVWQHQNRKLLFSPLSVGFLLVSLAFPFLWNCFFSQGNHNQSMVFDILAKFQIVHLKTYCLKLLLFPLDTWVKWLPLSGVLLYAWVAKHRRVFSIGSSSYPFKSFKIAFWILLLNYLPYWLAPQSHIRYLLPLYPFFALFLAYLIIQFEDRTIQLTLRLLIGCLVLKYILGFWGYGFFHQKIRGNYLATAQDILKKTEAYPVCAQDVTATGLSVVAEIDVLQLPKPPLRYCQAEGKDDFLLLPTPDALTIQNGKMQHIYSLGHHKLYLFCRGAACQKEIHSE